MWPFERKSLSTPTDEEIAILTGVPIGASGVSIAQALTVTAASSCVRLISEAAASLDVCVEKKTGNVWQSAPDHPVAALLASQPNEWSSTFDLVRDMIATALTNDKGALAYVNRIGGEVREIVRYEPAHFTVDYSGDGRQEPSFRINNVPQRAGDVIFIRSPFSRSPLSLAVDAISTAKAMEGHAKNLFRNGARPAGVIQSAKNLGKDALARMKKSWQAAHVYPAKVPDGFQFAEPWAFEGWVDPQDCAEWLRDKMAPTPAEGEKTD